MAAGDEINQFDGGLNKEAASAYLPKNKIRHARNAFPYSASGDEGGKSNEPANLHLVDARYPIIGTIYLYDDLWAIFSTNDVECELGVFREFKKEYTVLAGDTAFNWHRDNLITGEAKMNFDCTWSVYFSDGHRNPDRVVNINDVPLKGTYSLNNDGCRIFTPDIPHRVDTEKLRLNPPVKMPCIKMQKGSSGGNMPNGTYYAVIGYSVNGQKVTNYSTISNAISLFDHSNLAGSIEITLDGLDESYDEYELVIISIVNSQTVARKIGSYATNQKFISLDIIQNDLPAVPLEFLPVTNPLMESSDSITSLGDHLIRIAPKSKFDFNYQPRANLIETLWTVNEYPADYYRRGGVNLSYVYDENYPFFIRWVYDDFDRSPSFVIPGRAPSLVSGTNTMENEPQAGIFSNSYVFENTNTASIIDQNIIALGDGGFQILQGRMGYHDTDEVYPINQPEVWGNLCGKKIRLHKFPERSTHGRCNIYSDLPASSIQGPVIRVLGAKFQNIKGPVDNDGNFIKGIVGYEILVGSREGNKTVIAKGIINNMFEYELTDDTGKQGVYPNYPYNCLNNDPFLSTTETGTAAMTGTITNYNPLPGAGASGSKCRLDLMTFHSPETTFSRPFLSAQELKIDGIIQGEPILKFVEPADHPKHKLMTNLAFFIGTLVGLGAGVAKMIGGKNTSASTFGIPGGVAAGATGLAIAAASTLLTSLDNKSDDHNTLDNIEDDSGDIVEARDVGTVEPMEDQSRKDMSHNFGQILEGGKKFKERLGGIGRSIGKFFRNVAMGGIALFVQMWSEGVDIALTAIMNMSQWQQYALQQFSHCFYSDFYLIVPERFLLKTSKYLGQSFQEFDDNIRINNLYRTSTVALRTELNIPKPADIGYGPVPPLAFNSVPTDTSKQTLGTIFNGFTNATTIFEKPTKKFARTKACSYYASLKVRLRNQYGQIGNVKQRPAGCVNYVTWDAAAASNQTVFTSPTIFGGDIYITRYTEKNTMFFFYDWLFGQFDGQEHDYLKTRMLQWPAYWADTQKFDVADFVKGVSQNLGGSVTGSSLSNVSTSSPNNIKTDPWLPTGFRALDRKPGSTDVFNNNNNFKQSYFVVKEAYFYLFVSGVRDFYVESEINLGYRDWEEPIQKRFYDHDQFTDLKGMFKADPAVIKEDNFCKYDYSLSAPKTFVNMVSWGRVQPTWYDPAVAQSCFIHHPKTMIWSMKQNQGQITDSWRVFLTNNYRIFKSNITTVKAIDQTGAIVYFESDSPVMIQGDETLKLSSTTITIGDGSFLARMSQNITNADRPYQLGATKDARSIANTPLGLFWMSPEQGKIFTLNKGMLDIAMPEMGAWFARYLRYEILEDFPEYDMIGNPIMGVGCQTVYDSENGIIYFTKKDFKLKPLDRGALGVNQYIEYSSKRVTLGTTSGHFILYNSYPWPSTDPPSIVMVMDFDPGFFKETSWTISYNILKKEWNSHHDWLPDLVMPSKRTFNTIKGTGIWRHDDRCDKFCNFYGVDYPFEVEFEYSTGITETTLRSIEYYLQAYKYGLNCTDRYMYLDENFDEAVIFNNEQCSGLLKLILRDLQDPHASLVYPIYGLNSVDVLFSRVENKYRLNMVSDLTDDRGQDTNARRTIWNTADNGYVKTLNLGNINYQKDVFQQKKFRGQTCSVFFRRRVSGDVNLVLVFAKNKVLESKR